MLSACGVPTDSSARPIRDGVPFGLLAPATTVSATTTTAPGAATGTVAVFFVRDGRLVRAERQVPVPVSVPAALTALLDGPTDGEVAAGARSAISISARLLATEVEGDVVRLDLAGSFAEVQGGEQVLAVAQLVFTATAVEGVRGVTLALDGRLVEVPTADGTLKAGPVGPGDFGPLAPA
ncbi:MAG: GerMN domain-containing protein [Acidimicrobiales bacterium]